MTRRNDLDLIQIWRQSQILPKLLEVVRISKNDGTDGRESWKCLQDDFRADPMRIPCRENDRKPFNGFSQAHFISLSLSNKTFPPNSLSSLSL